MINKFRQSYNLDKNDYPDDKIYKILKNNYFDFENIYKYKDNK